MAKFDFNTSRYAHLFGSKSPDQRLLMSIVNDNEITGLNPRWYLSQGSIDPEFTPADASGIATFTVRERALSAAPLANLRAPLADTVAADVTGFNSYSATIPDFITVKNVETVASRNQKRKYFEAYGNDRDMLQQYAFDTARLISSMDSTMSYMTAQLMSTGRIVYKKGQGVFAPVHKADIPTDNFCKAGTKAWTDPEALIISYMADIEDRFRQKWGWYGPMVWQFTKKMFVNVFMKNKQVLEKVNEFRNLQDLVAVTFNTLNKSVFDNAWEQIRAAYGISPIEIVEEAEVDSVGGTDTLVHGWDDKIAVLRPAGEAVRFMRKEVLDASYAPWLNQLTSRNFASVRNGLGMVVNSTVVSGMYNEWHTVVLFSAVPALTEFTRHIIVDTSQAGS